MTQKKMDGQRRVRRDLAQNLAIALLTLTAAALFMQTQLYSMMGLDRAAPPLSVSAQSAGIAGLTELTAPVRLAVTGSYGRYGSAMTTGGQDFADPLGRRLAEALGSARNYTACTEAEFLAALSAPSVYYDFLEALPLPVLAMLAGGGGAEEDLSARRLILSGGPDGVMLYLWDGGEIFCKAATAVSADSLNQTVSQYELGSAVFALDEGVDLAPCSLLPKQPPELPILTAGELISDTNAFLSAIGFNPRVRTRYLESNGTELITDGNRTLRIRPDRTLLYNSGGDGSLKVNALGDEPTVQEAVLGAANLLSGLLPSGEASLYLRGVRQTSSGIALRFGYQTRGVPVRFSDGGDAAEVILSGRRVDSLSLRVRQYTATADSSLLLPLEQALAIAARKPGAELTIGYVDAGTDCAAHWLAE